MKLRYVWREIGDDGQLLDSDDSWPGRPLLNNCGGHPTRESAIEHYQKTNGYGIDTWATPRELVLLEVYRAD